MRVWGLVPDLKASLRRNVFTTCMLSGWHSEDKFQFRKGRVGEGVGVGGQIGG